jgi:hypothetical protein
MTLVSGLFCVVGVALGVVALPAPAIDVERHAGCCEPVSCSQPTALPFAIDPGAQHPACTFTTSVDNLCAEPPKSMAEKTSALAEEWKARFAEEKFNHVVASPYVIAGNGTAEQLARYRDGTILAATKALQTQFFTTPPDKPVLILLFENEGTYKRLAKKWLDDDEVPHFGYYRHWDRVMVMNVATGLGTLVHELTHALIAPDFPNVPDWFNEGLASLYEQSQFGPDAKSIKGLPNWRLPLLQKSIKEGTLRPLAELMADANFREGERVGINYAQARYVMLYLQEKGLLQKYYKACRDGHKADPTGLETLKKLVAPQTWEAFEKDWRAWVAAIKYPR